MTNKNKETHEHNDIMRNGQNQDNLHIDANDSSVIEVDIAISDDIVPLSENGIPSLQESMVVEENEPESLFIADVFNASDDCSQELTDIMQKKEIKVETVIVDSNIVDPKIENPKDENTKIENPKNENPKDENPKDIDSKTTSEDSDGDENSHSSIAEKSSSKRNRFIKVFRIVCLLCFLISLCLFLNETLVQPYLADKATNKAKSLYQMPTFENTEDSNYYETVNQDGEAIGEITNKTYETYANDLTRDQYGRLLAFRPLLELNQDVKGWIRINNLNGKNDTKIDYVVVQSSARDPEYYLDRDWLGKKVKSGSLFLDARSSVENRTKNLVIHGHNMTSTDDMFHYLLKYNNRDFYESHPIIEFNSIFESGQWKIFSVFITNGTSMKEPLFDYTFSEFESDSDYLNFIYQLRIRSIYNMDAVDVNEDDYILTLSTCSYEVKDYRTVIVARKVRPGEEAEVDTRYVYDNPTPLYPSSYYYRYGGKAPKLPATFQEALDAGMITWYRSEDEVLTSDPYIKEEPKVKDIVEKDKKDSSKAEEDNKDSKAKEDNKDSKAKESEKKATSTKKKTTESPKKTTSKEVTDTSDGETTDTSTENTKKATKKKTTEKANKESKEEVKVELETEDTVTNEDEEKDPIIEIDPSEDDTDSSKEDEIIIDETTPDTDDSDTNNENEHNENEHNETITEPTDELIEDIVITFD